MNDMTPIDTGLDLVRLSELHLSPLNTRQIYEASEIEDMAGSIAAVGLIQNLSGHRDETGIGIVAGGKRLLALQMLLAQDDLGDVAIPVRITDDPETAKIWSLTENAARSRPHPADEIRAFRDMFDASGDIDLIARTFAESTAHVRRRLSMASLAEPVLNALRANDISLNSAQTLTLARTPEEQIGLLDQLRAEQLHPNALRRAVTQQAISTADRRVQFVGLVRYLAEGGDMTEDLFSGESLLHNETLLDQLFKTALIAATDQVCADEEWQWATPIFDSYVGYAHTDKVAKLYRTPGDLPDADQERFDKLSDDLAASGLTTEAQGELDALQARLDGDFTDADHQTGGVFVYVDQDGKLQVSRAWQRAEVEADTPDDTADAPSAAVTKTETPAITQAGMDDLKTITRLALQSAAVAKYELLLDLLAFQFQQAAPTYRSPFNLTIAREQITPGDADSVILPTRLTVADGIQPDFNQTPEALLTAFKDFRAFGRSHRNALLAEHLARALQLPDGHTAALGQFISAEAGMNIRKIWTPTAKGYLKSCRVDVLDRIWCDLLGLEDGDPRIAEFGKKKKGDKAKELETLFTDTEVQEAHSLSRDQITAIDTWLPPELKAWANV